MFGLDTPQGCVAWIGILLTMLKGYYIRLFDTTSCGGVVQEATSVMGLHDKPGAREFDAVSCGIDGKLYQITGGIPHMISGGRHLAGTLHSRSSCPCRARLIPSLDAGTYTIADAQTHAAPGSPSIPTPAFGRAKASHPMTTHSLVDTELEEEEEEVEQEQLITLRIGVFFDGTGNNQANSETVAGCMARDVGLQDQSEDIRQFCATYGYGVDGSTPDNSYGNDTSNVARLYELYVDQADVSLGAEDEEASLKVYLEGIGTVSGGEDDRYGQATGRWGTGVLARVEQSFELIRSAMKKFKDNNPDIKIKDIDVDVFGFSRGAAAARHFANEILKGPNGLLARNIRVDSTTFIESFAWRTHRDINLNFVGLFDTVAGIVSPLVGDLNPGDARVSGLNLALPAGAARKIVQFVARDEHRLNFALTRTDNDILLPGAHSDIGGGYLPRTRERVLLSKPSHSLEMVGLPRDHAFAYSQLRASNDPWLRHLNENGIEWGIESWSVEQPKRRDEPYPTQRVYVAAKVEREVYGDLSKIYLRIMREMGMRHRVPFKPIDEHDARFALPKELTSIAEKLRAYTLHDLPYLNLTWAEERLLLRRYIHFSANWNAVMGFRNSDLNLVFINRPTGNYQRVMHANR